MSRSWPIVFMGTPRIAADTLEYLLAHHSDPVVGVVTQPDRPSGRGQRASASPVRRLAEARGIPLVAPEKIRTPEFAETLRGWQPAVVAVVAYGRILPKAILDLAPHGCINVHYSLLPKYRGAAPAAWTIINGDSEAGVTTMKLVEKMDAGAIYLQEAVPVGADETTGSLQAKLTPVGARLLVETLKQLQAGTLVARDQDERLASAAPMLEKEDGLIDWSRPAAEIERRVRGFDPWPGSFTHVGGKLLKVHRARVTSADAGGSPGEVMRADAAGFWVATSAGALALEEVQLENKKRLAGTEFIKGARIKIGDRLG
jgi:methionyl-tRNA formyltransferase